MLNLLYRKYQDTYSFIELSKAVSLAADAREATLENEIKNLQAQLNIAVETLDAIYDVLDIHTANELAEVALNQINKLKGE